ncbi:hypothetical protein QTP70_017651, partial [Hemibagrus guttatus]
MRLCSPAAWAHVHQLNLLAVEKQEKVQMNDSPSSSNGHGHSGVPKPPSGEDEPLVSNSCPSADSDSIVLTSEVPPTPENCVITISGQPEMTNETTNSKKRKRESKKNHVVQNGNIRQNDISDSGDVSPDVKVACSPVLVDSTRADTPTQDLVSSSRSTPPPKKHKSSVASPSSSSLIINIVVTVINIITIMIVIIFTVIIVTIILITIIIINIIISLMIIFIITIITINSHHHCCHCHPHRHHHHRRYHPIQSRAP